MQDGCAQTSGGFAEIGSTDFKFAVETFGVVGALLEAFDACGGDLDFCRQALGRVRAEVSKGRKISNRMAYLRRALNW